MNANKVYGGKKVYCEGENCHLNGYPIKGIVYHCPNDHDWCEQCVDQSPVGEVPYEEKTETEDSDTSDCDVVEIENKNDANAEFEAVCPLSLQRMREPVKSTQCDHIFDRQNILNYIAQTRDAKYSSQHKKLRKRNRAMRVRVPCPEQGCPAEFMEDDFEIIQQPVLKKRRLSTIDLTK